MQQTVTTIQGERVLLRPPQEGDAEESCRVWTPELRHMYGGSLTAPATPAVEPRRARFERALRGENGHFLCIQADGRYIGFAIIDVTDEGSKRGRYRIGIENPEYWGRGYGTEVTRLMLRYAFEELELHRVDLRVAAYNTRAIRCYEKSGFRLEGTERDSFFVDGEWHDDLLMAILRPEWEARLAEQPAAPEVTIRTYRGGDYEQVADLWREAWGELRPSDSREALAYKLMQDRGPFLVAEVDGSIVGTALLSWDGRWAWVTRVAVRQDYRRRGIARMLMAELERAAVRLGASQVSLLTSKENPAALGLYEGLGYRLRDFVGYMSKRFEVGEEGCCGG